MQRIPEETIRGWVLAEDESIRKRAIRYLSANYPDDPTIFPLVIQAVEKYGLSVVDRLFSYSLYLRQTPATVAWILEKLASDEVLELDVIDISIIDDLTMPLEFADVSELIDQREKILENDAIGERRRNIIRKKFELLETDEASCWLALEKYCRAEADYAEGQEDPADVHYPNEIVEALVRLGPTDRDRLGEWLNHSHDVVELSVLDAWKCIVAVKIAGDTREAAFADVLVRYISQFPGEDFLITNCSKALMKIGGAAVVEAIAAFADQADVYFWTFAAEILGHNRSDAAIAFLIERLEVENDLEIRNHLASALIQQCVPGAIDIARQVVLENRERNDRLIDSIGLKSDLILFADLLGERFPEYDEWKQELETRFSGWPFFANISPEVKPKKRADQTSIITPLEPISRPLIRAGRNDPCPCGSGKKYKKCCLKKSESVVVEESADG